MVQPAHAAVHMQHHHLALNNRRKNYLETETTEAGVLTHSLDVYTALCRVHSGEAHYSSGLPQMTRPGEKIAARLIHRQQATNDN